MTVETGKPPAANATAQRSPEPGRELPSRPDFAALEAAAPASADKRTRILALIGNLVYGWSNNESMLIYVLMVLLETDKVAAAIVFATLNTTRARLDLIQRLAKAKLGDRALLGELEKLVDRFNRSTRDRNEFNHCMFSVNELGEITHTHAMRVRETRRGIQFGETKPLDQTRIEEMQAAVVELRILNRDIWDFLPRLEAHMTGSRPARAARMAAAEQAAE
jgi:hypothetical protein